MMPYRAEICGLVSVFFLLNWLCNSIGVTNGSAVNNCDNLLALNQVFHSPRASNNPLSMLQTYINLIICTRDLQLQLPLEVKLMKQWVKDLYEGHDRKLSHILNDLANSLTVHHNLTTCSSS